MDNMIEEHFKYLKTPYSKELVTMIEATYKRYKETPKWHYLQAMFRLTLELGIEIGKTEILCHHYMTNEEQGK